MRISVFLAAFALAAISTASAFAACTRPAGNYVGGGTDYYFSGSSTPALSSLDNALISMKINADYSGSGTVMASVIGSTTITTVSFTFTSANNTFSSKTCLGQITATFNGHKGGLLYSSATGGTELTIIPVAQDKTDLTAATYHLKQQ